MSLFQKIYQETSDPDGFENLHKIPEAEYFVIVEFKANKNYVFYIGKVVKRCAKTDEYEINFLRNQKKAMNKFVFQDVPDISIVFLTDIKFIMPSPILCGHTSRQKESFTFELDFILLNIR